MSLICHAFIGDHIIRHADIKFRFRCPFNVNVLYYAVLTSYIVQKSDETKSHSCTVVSAGSAVSVIVLSIGITLFGTFVQQNDLDTLLRHSDSPNENYTVEVRGSRKARTAGTTRTCI